MPVLSAGALVLSLRAARRSWRRQPVATLAAVLTIALGVAACTIGYGVVRTVLLDELAVDDPGGLVRLLPDHRRFGESDGALALADLRDLAESSTTLSGVAAYENWSATLDLVGGAQQFHGATVSENFFDVVGVRPSLGRFFTEDDVASVVLSFDLWVERFGEDEGVLGEVLSIGQSPYIVIGVASPNMVDLELDRAESARRPMIWRAAAERWDASGRAERGTRAVTSIARLAEGATLATADREVRALFARLEDAYPDTNAEWSARAVHARAYIVEPVRAPLLLLLGIVSAVLVVSCVNVATLLFARQSSRTAEIGVRAALGASRADLSIGSAVEQGLVLFVGGLIGTGAAILLLPVIARHGSSHLPRFTSIAPGVGDVLFGVTVAASAATLIGAVHGWYLSRPSPARILTRGFVGARRRRLTPVRALIAIQTAISIALVGAGAQMLMSLTTLQAQPLGFAAENLNLASIRIPGSVAASDDELWSTYSRILEAYAAGHPESVVAIANIPPFTGGYWASRYSFSEVPSKTSETSPSAEVRVVSSSFDRVMSIALAEGRFFDSRDQSGQSKTAVVNRALLADYGINGSPVGLHLEVFGGGYSVIGVVDDVREFGLDRPPEPAIYLALHQAPQWLLRTAWIVERGGALEGLLPAVRTVDPRIATGRSAPMAELVQESTAIPRFNTMFLVGFGLLTLTLATLGTFGTAAQAVSNRSHEISVRSALGAHALVRLLPVLRWEVASVAFGALSGAAIGMFALSRLEHLFFAGTTDVGAWVVAVLLPVLSSAAAMSWPLLRAGRPTGIPNRGHT